jgi:energy-coupling factor transporter transmembrane protein EcfT
MKSAAYEYLNNIFLQIDIILLILGVRIYNLMKRTYRNGLFFIILILAAIMLLPACAASKKNPYLSKKAASHINTSQLGRNKYFFSPQYQKKLFKFKKK